MTLINETSIIAADLCDFKTLENLRVEQIKTELQKKYGIDIVSFGELMKDIQKRLTVDFSILNSKISSGFRPINLNDGSLLFKINADENLIENRERFIEYLKKSTFQPQDIKDLRLTLLTDWFEMTKSGVKKEDYREINQHWFKRFVKDYKNVFHYYTGHKWENENVRDEGIEFIAKSKHKMFEFVSFSSNIMTLGYPKAGDNSRILHLEHKGIRIGTGNPDWGAKPNKLYFVVSHGDILEQIAA